MLHFVFDWGKKQERSRKEMTYIKENWANKENRAEQAQRHTEEMQKKYHNEILKSIQNTKIYDVDFQGDDTKENKNTKIIVEDSDTVYAASRYNNDGKTALLNFSSYKNPGGMFINGSKAQEECLCHASYLYNVLIQFTESFYNWNNQHKNKALYLNRGLYSPNILFQQDEKLFYCNVITCAAPNKSAARRYQKVSNEENTEILQSRIKFVLDIARENHIDTLILGAYGCGVFGQSAEEVAKIFKNYLETTHKCFKKVIFAIPKGKDKNLQSFESVFHS